MKERILFVFSVVLVVVLSILAGRKLSQTIALERQVRDLQVQLAHSNIPVVVDTIHDSIPVVTVKTVVVDKTDYKQQLADRELIKDLQLKLADVQEENRWLRETAGKVVLHGEDSDTVVRYRDRWATFSYNRRSKELDYLVRDSVVTFLTRIPKHRFLWWRWGVKGYKVSHVNFNPNTEVKFESFVVIKSHAD